MHASTCSSDPNSANSATRLLTPAHASPRHPPKSKTRNRLLSPKCTRTAVSCSCVCRVLDSQERSTSRFPPQLAAALLRLGECSLVACVSDHTNNTRAQPSPLHLLQRNEPAAA
eukprot:1063866-Rhodomonas_salina.1